MVCKQNLVCCFVYIWLMPRLFRNHGPTPEVWWWKLLPVKRLSLETKFHQTQWFKEPWKSFIWNILHLIDLCPTKGKAKIWKEPCLCCCNTWKQQMMCVTPEWASSAPCSSRERVEVPCSSTVCWDQQRVPITQPVAQPQNPQWQHWWKPVPLLCRDGARSQGQPGHQDGINLSLRGRKAPKYSLSGIATDGKLSSCQIQELLLYLKLKRKGSFFRFLENQKPWISASLQRTPYTYPYVQIMYLYGYLISENSPAEKAGLKGAISTLTLVPEVRWTEICLFLP